MSAVNEMAMAELSERSGFPARTIRYYISRGLVDGPVRLGRGAAYTEGHLQRLRRIRELKQEGLTLKEIGHRLAAAETEEGLADPTEWQRYRVAEDVVVFVSGEAAPWRLRHIRSTLSDMADRLES